MGGGDSNFPEIGNKVQVTVGVSENSSEFAAVLCFDMSSTSRETQHSSDDGVGLGVNIDWISGGVGYIDDLVIGMGVSIDGMARVQGAVFAGAVYDQRLTAYDETDQRPSVYDETDQGATYDEFDIGFGSRPNGVNLDAGGPVKLLEIYNVMDGRPLQRLLKMKL